MANASGKQCVNLHSKKHSFLVLEDAAGRFNGTTRVTAVKDVKPGNNVADFDFDKKPKGNSNRVTIKIKGNGTKSAASGIMPLDGTLQVTLTSTPPIPVNDIPVTYCDDDEVPIP